MEIIKKLIENILMKFKICIC